MIDIILQFIKTKFIILLQIITLLIGVLAIIVSVYTAILTKKNQKRTERYLMYQFKLESLNKEISKKSSKLSKPINNSNKYEKCTDKALRNALNIKKISNKYEEVYKKMIEEFGLKGI